VCKNQRHKDAKEKDMATDLEAFQQRAAAVGDNKISIRLTNNGTVALVGLGSPDLIPMTVHFENGTAIALELPNQARSGSVFIEPNNKVMKSVLDNANREPKDLVAKVTNETAGRNYSASSFERGTSLWDSSKTGSAASNLMKAMSDITESVIEKGGKWATSLEGLVKNTRVMSVASPLVNSMSIVADYKEAAEKIQPLVEAKLVEPIAARDFAVAVSMDKAAKAMTMGQSGDAYLGKWVAEHPEISSSALDKLGLNGVRDLQNLLNPKMEFAQEI
jgi:hypothetical protein